MTGAFGSRLTLAVLLTLNLGRAALAEDYLRGCPHAKVNECEDPLHYLRTKDVVTSTLENQPICLTDGGVKKSIVPKTRTDVEQVIDQYAHRDLAKFIAAEVWKNYAVAVLLQDQVEGAQGCGSAKTTASQMRTRIDDDARIEGASAFSSPSAQVNQCFSKLGLPDPTRTLTAQIHELRCVGQNAIGRACSGETDGQKGDFKAYFIGEAQKKAQQLTKVQAKIEELESQFKSVKIEGCDSKFDCLDYIKKRHWCELEAKLSDFGYEEKCKTAMNRLRARGIDIDGIWHRFETLAKKIENIKAIRDSILNSNPELAIELPTPVGSRIVNKPIWRKINDQAINAPNAAGLTLDFLSRGLRMSRQKRLSFLLRQVCDEDFARHVLATRPDLVDRFMRSGGGGKEIAPLLCRSRYLAECRQILDRGQKDKAKFALGVLGLASGLPFFGEVALLELVGAAVATGLPGEVWNLHDLASERRIAIDSHHACMGDVQRVRAAESAFEDAVIDASVTAGVAVALPVGGALAERVIAARKMIQAAKDVKSDVRNSLIRKLDDIEQGLSTKASVATHESQPPAVLTPKVQLPNAEIKISISDKLHESVPFVSHNDGQGYLAMNLNNEAIEEVRVKLASSVGLDASVLLRRGESHLTLVSPVEVSKLKRYLSIEEIERIAEKTHLPSGGQGVQRIQFEISGLGHASHAQYGDAFFLLLDSKDARAIRDAIAKEARVKGAPSGLFNPLSFEPHITIGYTKRDLHRKDGVFKDLRTLVENVSLQGKKVVPPPQHILLNNKVRAEIRAIEKKEVDLKNQIKVLRESAQIEEAKKLEQKFLEGREATIRLKNTLLAAPVELEPVQVEALKEAFAGASAHLSPKKADEFNEAIRRASFAEPPLEKLESLPPHLTQVEGASVLYNSKQGKNGVEYYKQRVNGSGRAIKNKQHKDPSRAEKLGDVISRFVGPNPNIIGNSSGKVNLASNDGRYLIAIDPSGGYFRVQDLKASKPLDPYYVSIDGLRDLNLPALQGKGNEEATHFSIQELVNP